MMCYRDMTFCGYKDCVKFGNCWRSLTDEVIQSAEEWWEDGENQAPICQFAEQPDCFMVKEETIGVPS